jgi:hypothetical protein
MHNACGPVKETSGGPPSSGLLSARWLSEEYLAERVPSLLPLSVSVLGEGFVWWTKQWHCAGVINCTQSVQVSQTVAQVPRD